MRSSSVRGSVAGDLETQRGEHSPEDTTLTQRAERAEGTGESERKGDVLIHVLEILRNFPKGKPPSRRATWRPLAARERTAGAQGAPRLQGPPSRHLLPSLHPTPLLRAGWSESLRTTENTAAGTSGCGARGLSLSCKHISAKPRKGCRHPDPLPRPQRAPTRSQGILLRASRDCHTQEINTDAIPPLEIPTSPTVPCVSLRAGFPADSGSVAIPA